MQQVAVTFQFKEEKLLLAATSPLEKELETLAGMTMLEIRLV